MRLLYTQSGIRLKCVVEKEGNQQLVLIPGGPGMGSEYFSGLVKGINAPMSIWLADLPGNGNNIVDQPVNYDRWPQLVPEISSKVEGDIIYLGHSFGGMVLLSEPAIERQSKAFVLMSTLPRTIFNAGGESYFEDPEFQRCLLLYQQKPSNEAFRRLVVALSPFYFETHDMPAGTKMLKETEYAHQPYDALRDTFLQHYQASYIPDIPCLILSGEVDIVTPLTYFQTDSRFKKDNISIQEVRRGNHFPWINNSEETYKALNLFLQSL